MVGVKLPLRFDSCPFSISVLLIMNIIIWNSRGSLKPNFQSYVGDLAHNHNPAILVVMETKISGDRVKEITDRLPFDSAIHFETLATLGACDCFGIQLGWRCR